MVNFSLNEIIEGLKEYYSEKAAKLLAKYFLEERKGFDLPIIAVLNGNGEYEASIAYDVIKDFYEEFNNNSFIGYLKENEKDFRAEDIVARDEDLILYRIE